MGFASFILGAVLQSMLALLLAPGVSSPLAAAPQPSLTYAAVPASGEWLLQLMPSCNGIRTLPQPAVFSWPNLDRRRRQLTGSNWGYFTCMQTPDAAARFYRERLTKAPYQMKEISWVARREGTREGRWTLLDYVDIVVHIQHQDERDFYALDRLWRDCPVLAVDLL